MTTTEQLEAALAGRYSIERLIGEGGMATVYLAQDIRHRRRVAVKVLRPDLGAVLGVERFLSEIQVTANLQHPNLLPLFDSGEANGLLFYVMPYVEGESLRAKLDRERQLPVDDAVRIATAVGSALDYAHRHGVIHRDLKPENILLHEGQPVVADFGIALAVSNAGGGRITQTGLSLGTPHYMSPEQATGDRVIDARTDVYSLGAVTYEMLVGEPPHTGGTSQAIIARVLTERPRPVRATRPSVPPHVEAAVERALEKLAPDRFASVREFNDAITGARPVIGTGMSPVDVVQSGAKTKGRVGVREMLGWGLAAAAIMVSAFQFARPSKAEPPAMGEFLVPLPDTIRLSGAPGSIVGISRDGATVVFAAVNSQGVALYERRLGERRIQLLEGTVAARSPVLSPDGAEVLFTTAVGQLKRMSLRGGTPRVISDSASTNGMASWGDNGVIAYSRSGRLFTLPAEGGAPTLLASADSSRQHTGYAWPSILPGGRAALITIWKGAPASLAAGRLGAVTIPEGKIIELGDLRGTNPQYDESSGQILFGAEESILFAVPFDPKALKLKGRPAPVLEGIAISSTGGVSVAVSANGTMAFVSGTAGAPRTLVSVSRKGVETDLGLREGFYQSPRVSPDGANIALTSYAGAGVANQNDPSPDIWRYDLRSRNLSRVTTDSTSVRPVWSADGSRIAYVKRGDTTVMWRDMYGTERPTVVARSSVPIFEVTLGPAHGYGVLRVDRAGAGNVNDLYYFHVDSAFPARPLLTEPFNESEARISPDGKLLAYTTLKTGRAEVYVREFPFGRSEVLVSTDGGSEPAWSPAGKELFFRGPRHLIAAQIATVPRLDVTRRDTLFTDKYLRAFNAFNYSVFPDGNRFAMLREPGEDPAKATQLIVRMNWNAKR